MMRISKNWLWVILLTAVVGLGLPSAPAWADPQLDFGVVAPTPGTISYLGGANPLVGTNIEVDNVAGIGGTPANNNVVLAVTGGLMNFTTGNLTGSTATTWSFGGGPLTTITITGGIPALLIPDGTTLLSGTFGVATVTDLGGSFKIAGSSFADTKNETLASYYGMGGFPGWNGHFNISFETNATAPSAFTSVELFSGDVVNTPVPEPATMLLLGSGLIGLAGFARKKFKK
jgi:hypothetical protein